MGDFTRIESRSLTLHRAVAARLALGPPFRQALPRPKKVVALVIALREVGRSG